MNGVVIVIVLSHGQVLKCAKLTTNYSSLRHQNAFLYSKWSIFFNHFCWNAVVNQLRVFLAKSI